jgi:hypothetical protein
LPVIKSFKHKGLKRYYETGSKSGIQAKHAARLRLQMAALDTAQVIELTTWMCLVIGCIRSKDGRRTVGQSGSAEIGG